MKVQVKDILFQKSWKNNDEVPVISGRLLGEVSEDELLHAIAVSKASEMLLKSLPITIPEVMPVMEEEDE